VVQELIRDGSFGPFHCQGQEILRRIFVTVRDRDWREIAPSHWHCTVDEAGHRVTVEARHTSDQVDFEWQGILKTSEDGRSVEFALEGKARRTMDICRLGLVVLHPVDAMVGAHLTAQGPDGTETWVVSSTIAAQPIVEGKPAAMLQPFTSLRIERENIGCWALEFDGDLFEIEDQRNWGDASFKTYCTPLRLGFPRQVRQGTRIAQRVALEFVPARGNSRARDRAAPQGASSGIFPRVGREWRGAVPLAVEELDWHHRYVDFAAYRVAAEISRLLEGCRTEQVEIGVVDAPTHDEDRGSESLMAALVSWIAAHRSRVARVLLSEADSSPASAASVADWRQALVAAGASDVQIFSATRGYFVEFNRASSVTLGAADGMAFPLCATVHGDDSLTIAENVATIGNMADTARRLTQAENLCIAPLALYYPAPAASTGFPSELIDPWLMATLLHAAAGGVCSVTLAEDVVIGASVPLLDFALRCGGLSVRLLPRQPAGVHAAVLRGASDRQARVVGINLRGAPSKLHMESVGAALLPRGEVEERVGTVTGSVVNIAPFGVRWFDQNP
jgi:hypothetical protein